MRLKNFFKSPSSWIKGFLATDMNDDPINLNLYSEFEMKDRRIKAMSLHGAIGYFYSYEREPEQRNKIMAKIRKAIEIHTGKNLYIAQFNNLDTTTFEDITKVLNIADKI